MKAESRPPGTAIELLWVPPRELHPNLYNANVLDDDLYEKAVASIDTYGFVDPVTVRVVDEEFVIIDGENRVRAAKDLALRLVPVIVLDVDEDTAQQLTLVLNELRGRPDQGKLRRVLAGLSERHDIDTLMKTLPFAREQFMTVAMPALPALSALTIDTPETTRWVERMYRLPRPAADVLDAALNQAKEYEEVKDDWRALEAIAKRYLDGV